MFSDALIATAFSKTKGGISLEPRTPSIMPLIDQGVEVAAPFPVPLTAVRDASGRVVISHNPITISTATPPGANSNLLKYALIGLAAYLLLKK